MSAAQPHPLKRRPADDDNQTAKELRAKQDGKSIKELEELFFGLFRVDVYLPGSWDRRSLVEGIVRKQTKGKTSNGLPKSESPKKVQKISEDQKSEFNCFTFSASVSSLALRHPRTHGVHYAYGTAGFRGPAETLSSVMLRMGMLACVRSRSEKDAKGVCRAVAVMITASHNPEEDNGIKLIDPLGEMMSMDWESLATDVANAKEDELADVLQKVGQIKRVDWSVQPRVLIGRDTRSTSPKLSNLVAAGIRSMGGKVIDYGEVTTPQLHYMVRCTNLSLPVKLDHYYSTIADAFIKLVSKHGMLKGVTVDCANGVGYISLAKFTKRIGKVLPICERNTGEGALNKNCGADFVQKSKCLPQNFDKTKDVGKKLCSLDGDADRIVYFYVDTNGLFHLLDGDKILCLYVTLIAQLVKKANLKLSIGVIQTAYANGASTQYIEKTLKVPVQCAKTGVKHLHPKAEEYDIGVYFEANGHGTVLFSEKALRVFSAKQKNSKKKKEKYAISQLISISQLINPCVGDAVSDMLMAEVAMTSLGYSIEDWDGMYCDLPSRMLKVKVKDRTVVKTTNAERTCTAPVGLQDKIDQLVGSLPNRRSFVRPSGTEDVVRVYAEADTKKEADALAQDVAAAVEHFCK